MGDEDEKVGGAEPSCGQEAGITMQGVVYNVANKKEAGGKEGDEHTGTVCSLGPSFDAYEANRHGGSAD